MTSKIHDLHVDDYLLDCVRIIPEAIQEEFCRVPADVAYWGEQSANALQAWKTAKLSRERTEAELHIKTRELLIAQGTKRPTVGDIEAVVLLSPDYESAKLAEIRAEATWLSTKNRFGAVCAKKDMIQSLGAHLRVEMERDPMVRERERTRRQIRDETDRAQGGDDGDDGF